MSGKDQYAGESVEALRERLDGLDLKILELIAERQALVTEIGARKHSDGKALRDFRREREVIELGKQRAEKLGLNADIARDIMERLIHHSLSRQEQRQIVSSQHGAGRSALVIGGLGRMGDWLARYLDSLGYGVEIADPGDGESLFPRITDWRQSPLDHDLIAVCAPLRSSNRILQQLAERRPVGLVFDIGSLKSPLAEGLEAMRAAGCRIASVHPMFGPRELMLSGRHILLVDAGHAEALAEARELFAHTAAECVELGLQEHDEVMGWVLGLSHLLNIAFAAAISESGEEVPLLRDISSTTFNHQLNVAAQVVSENPHLYFEIQAGTHPETGAAGVFARSLEGLIEAISAGDENAFVGIMNKARDYLARPASGAEA
jgi:chorismate mutase/prephenate dehydrogenase